MEIISHATIAAVCYTKSERSPDPIFILRSILGSPVLWGTICFIAGFSLFFRGFPLLQRKRLILNTPTSTVRAASLGAVEISGKVVGPYTLISPLSESDCFYYRAVAHTSTSGEQQKKTRLAEESLYVPFFLDDGTGCLMVDPRGAEMDLRTSLEEEYSPSQAAAFTRHFLARHGISVESSVTLEEYCIREGDHLFVLGRLQENSALGEDQINPLNGPKTGFLSAEAADLQRRAALDPMHLQPENAGAPEAAVDGKQFDVNPPVVLAKGIPGQPFFISWRSQKNIVQILAWESVLCIWGGPILAVAGLSLLVSRFFI